MAYFSIRQTPMAYFSIRHTPSRGFIGYLSSNHTDFIYNGHTYATNLEDADRFDNYLDALEIAILTGDDVVS